MGNLEHTTKLGLHARELIGLFLGPILALIVYFIGPPESLGTALLDGQSPQNAWVVLCLLVWMAVWWITEAIPIPVTALLPLVVLPFTGTQTMKATSSEYMHPIIVLLLGGFIIAKAIERWGLHKRIALKIISAMGAKPQMILAGFMAAAAILSMWISNSATSIMLLPIAISLIGALQLSSEAAEKFTYAVLLGIAYACSIGGLGTPVGTPTNLIVMGYLSDNMGLDIDFATWMMIGVPTVLVLVPVTWFLLTRFIFKLQNVSFNIEQSVIQDEVSKLGKLSKPEKRVLIVFAVVAFMWSFKNILNDISFAGWEPFRFLSDQITAIFGVILCFLIPSGSSSSKILDWKTAESIPWGPLILFGGGMALAVAIQKSGLALWVGQELSFISTLGPFLLVLMITMIVIFMTEVMSNVATAATLMPVFGAAAMASGVSIELLAFPIALAASCAFMLPTATGPNAVIFSSGKISLPKMARTGFMINLASVLILSLIGYFFVPLFFN